MYKEFKDIERKYIFTDRTESTNSDIKSMIYGSKEAFFGVVSAGEQTGGRGRLGRNFFSPDGGLYFSFSLPLNGNEKNIPFITLLAGLTVSKAIEELTGAYTEIKWPNDIYINGRKLGGILCELVCKNRFTAVIGVGINLTVLYEDIPSELQQRMTSFVIEKIPVPDKKTLIGEILKKFDKAVYADGELYEVSDAVISEIRRRSYSIGKKVRYSVNNAEYDGVLINITRTGAAEIRLSDGTVKEIFCGEII